MKKLLLFFSLCIFTISLYGQQIDTIFWEEFDGEIPSSWTLSSDPVGADWQWTATGRADSALLNGTVTPALFWGAGRAIISPTVANGAAMLNADVYDGGGINPGQGPFPGGTTGTLESPSIDCSNFPHVTLVFNQNARILSSTVSTVVEFSIDGGTTWTEADPALNREIVGNTSTDDDDIQVFNLDAAGGQSDVKVRFVWDGRFYYWIIDDVRLIATPDNNLSMKFDDFFVSPESFALPVSQLDSFLFFAQISNLGIVDQTNVNLYVAIRDANLDTLHIDSARLEMLPAGAIDSIVTIENLYDAASALDVGSYFLTYGITSDSTDFDSNDNFQFRRFQVTDSLYSKDDFDILAATGPANNDAPWEIGNLYFVPTATTATQVTFSAATFNQEEQVTLLLYRLSDTAPVNFTDEDLTAIGFGTYTFQADDESFDEFTVDLLDSQTGLAGVAIEPGEYIITAQYTPEMNVPFSILQYTFGRHTVLRTSRWFAGGFGEDFTAQVRLHISNMVVGVEDTQLKDSEISIYPNPTKNLINLSVNLENPSEEMIVRIIDGAGRAIKMDRQKNVKENIFTYDMSNYPVGMYYFYIRTDEGVKTKRVVVK